MDQWEPVLEKFYDDPSTWALALQLRILLSYVSCPDTCIVERSPVSGRHVFGQLLFNDGTLRQDEWDVYKEYCEVLGWMPDVIVYVHTPSDVCHSRIKERARPSEKDVDVQYIKRVEFQYETMLRYATVPVLRLNGLDDPESLARALADIYDKTVDKHQSDKH